MQITVNGTLREVADSLTISDLLAQLGLDGPVAVERNREVVPRVDHPRAALAPGDVLEIVHFVGGG